MCIRDRAHVYFNIVFFVVLVSLLAQGWTIPLLALPLAVPAGWRLPDGTAPALWTLVVLAVTVGLPFLALSTASPTFQRWFSLSGHRHAADPYFLLSLIHI